MHVKPPEAHAVINVMRSSILTLVRDWAREAGHILDMQVTQRAIHAHFNNSEPPINNNLHVCGLWEDPQPALSKYPYK